MTDTLSQHQGHSSGANDPLNAEPSDLEQRRLSAIRDTLSKESYRSALELGCGNGALAAQLVPMCGRYVGVDAAESAVCAARTRVPKARFLCDYYPCRLPDVEVDLIVLSEILSVLSPAAIENLARDILEIGPRAEILCTIFLGDREHAHQGVDCVRQLRAALEADYAFRRLADTGNFRIDRGLPRWLP